MRANVGAPVRRRGNEREWHRPAARICGAAYVPTSRSVFLIRNDGRKAIGSHPRSRNGFFRNNLFLRELCFTEKLWFASAPPGHQTPSSAWWRDAALERKSTSGAALCHWAGELTARQAAEPPSRRAAECTSARKSSPPRPHRPQGQFKMHPAKWHVHTPPCSAFPLHSSPTHACAWPFVVARATQLRGRKRSRPTGIG